MTIATTKTPDLERGAKHVLSLDLEAYRHLLPSDAMTEAQQTEFLETLWSVVVGFVDLGFSCHPVQQAIGVGKRTQTLAGDAHAMISCGQAFNRKSNIKAAPENLRAARKKES